MILFVVEGKGWMDFVEWGYHGVWGGGVVLNSKYSDIFSLYSLSCVCSTPST